MRRITPQLIMLAGAMAGVTACQSDPMKGVESAQDQAQAHAVEAHDERTELARDHAQERAELVHEQNADAVDQAQHAPHRSTPGEQLENRNALALKQTAERAELSSEQASERADVAGDIERQRQRDLDRLARAHDEASQEKRDFAVESRAKLRKLEERANALSAKRGEAEPDERVTVNQELSTLPAKCKEAERVISNVESASSSEEWARAKSRVQNSLASIERSLEKVDRLL